MFIVAFGAPTLMLCSMHQLSLLKFPIFINFQKFEFYFLLLKLDMEYTFPNYRNFHKFCHKHLINLSVRFLNAQDREKGNYQNNHQVKK